MIRLLCFSLCISLAVFALEHKRVCYYTNWSQYRPEAGKYFPENIDVNLCTHLIFTFAKLSNNELKPMEWNDESTELSKGLYERFTDLKKKNPELKTLLAVGGSNAGTEEMTNMLMTIKTRAHFIKTSIKYLRDRNFDGLELAFVYPGSFPSPPEDRKRFTVLLQEFQPALNEESLTSGKERLLLTAAVAAGIRYINYEIGKINELLDFINLMSYDYHGDWNSFTGHPSPLYRNPLDYDNTLNLNWSANYWVSNGASPAKLNLGMPTYGRCFVLKNPADNGIGAPVKGMCPAGPFTGEAGLLSYYEVCKYINSPESQIFWSKEQEVPYLVSGSNWIGFENQKSFKLKFDYMKENGYGGWSVWDTSMDDFSGSFCNEGSYPLIKVLNENSSE